MEEEFLHYIWRYRRFTSTELSTTAGERVTILDPGEYNTDAGPDFTNARVKIGDNLWAGNVEIHYLTSDWIRHTHQNDPAYSTVILHVVYQHDPHKFTRDAQPACPVLELKKFVDLTLYDNYKRLKSSLQWIACEKGVVQVESSIKN